MTGFRQIEFAEDSKRPQGGEHLRLAGGGNDDHFLAYRNRRTEITAEAREPLAPFHFARYGFDAGQHAVIAHQEQPLPVRQKRRYVGSRLTDFIGQFRGRAGFLGRANGHHVIASPATAAATEYQTAGDDRRTATPLVESLVICPKRGARSQIQRPDAMRETVDQQRRIAGSVLIHARGGIGRLLGIASGGLPPNVPGGAVQGHDKPIVHIFIGHDQQVAMNERRGSRAMTAGKGTEILLPNRIAVMTVGRQINPSRSAPTYVDPFGVYRRRRRSDAIKTMHSVRPHRNFLLPFDVTASSGDAHDLKLARPFVGSGKKDPPAPTDRRRMSPARQPFFPGQRIRRQLPKTQGFGSPAGSVRSAKAGPFLRHWRQVSHQDSQGQNSENECHGFYRQPRFDECKALIRRRSTGGGTPSLIIVRNPDTRAPRYDARTRQDGGQKQGPLSELRLGLVA